MAVAAVAGGSLGSWLLRLIPPAEPVSPFAVRLGRMQQKNIKADSKAKAATLPMEIPAIAPPLNAGAGSGGAVDKPIVTVAVDPCKGGNTGADGAIVV